MMNPPATMTPPRWTEFTGHVNRVFPLDLARATTAPVTWPLESSLSTEREPDRPTKTTSLTIPGGVYASSRSGTATSQTSAPVLRLAAPQALLLIVGPFPGCNSQSTAP